MDTLEKDIKFGRFSVVKQKWLFALSIIGPGIIAGTADNDAGGITTYSVVGSTFGYKMLWILVVIALILAITQEMGARLGLVTGKGLAALIRENFSLKMTTFVVVITFAANWANVLAEYAGIASVADIYGIPRYVMVPLAALLTYFVVYQGSFKMVQRIFLSSSVLFLAYVAAGLMAHPDWTAAWQGIVQPGVDPSPAFFYMAVAMIGTTITAWGQFFVQSYYVDKGVAAEHLKFSRWDVFAGAFWTTLIALFIVLATAGTLHSAGITINDAGDAAKALEPLAGSMAKHLFAWGLFNASMLGLAVVSMTSSYLVTEAFGWEGRVDLKKESPAFYGIFAFCIFSGALAVLIPHLPLIPILVGSQMMNTFVLPVLFVAILKLLNNKELMGKYKNTKFGNFISLISILFIVVMASLLVVLTLTGYGQ